MCGLLAKACKIPPAGPLTCVTNIAEMGIAPQQSQLPLLPTPVMAPVSAPVPVPAPSMFNEPAVTLWASELSSYMGNTNGDASSFQSRTRALGGVWKRTNEAQFRAVMAHWRANGCMLQGDAAARQMHDPFPDVRTADDVRAFCKSHPSADIMRLYKAKGRLCEDELVARFAQSIQREVSCRHTAITWHSNQAPLKLRDGVVTQRPPGPLTDPGTFSIVGEVDGYLQDGPYAGSVVEIKLRLQELRQQVPLRDYMQIQTYLQLFQSPMAFYVQGLFGTEQLLVKPILRNPDEWQRVIMPELREFVCDVRRLLRGAPEDMALRALVLQECNAEPLPARDFVPDVPQFRAAPSKVTAPVAAVVPLLAQIAPLPLPAPPVQPAAFEQVDESKVHDAFFESRSAPKPKPKAASTGLAKRLTRDMLACLEQPCYNLRSKSRKRARA